MVYITYIMDPAVPEQAVPVPDRTWCPNTGTGKMECQEQGSGTGFWPGTQNRSCTISDMTLSEYFAPRFFFAITPYVTFSK
jgi:hypothetical protein